MLKLNTFQECNEINFGNRAQALRLLRSFVHDDRTLKVEAYRFIVKGILSRNYVE